MKSIILIPSLNNSLLHNLPGYFFGKTDFFLAFDTFSADSSCQLLSYTQKKTQLTMIEHLHKLAKYWCMAVDIPSARPVTDRKKNFLAR